MTKKTILAAVLSIAALTTANAGGMLTNTNQSVAFLRNPARDAAIGVDGVYSNPAGVALLKDGFHIGVNWQTAIQTRTVQTTSPFLDHTLGTLNPDGTPKQGIAYPTKQYRGHATAPIIPSVQAAYNKNKWSFQFNFAITGGGGKCEFSKGLGTFENAVGQIGTQLMPLGAMGYSCDNYMEGSQYYYGITLGAAYKIIDKEKFKVSAYGGLRALIGSASYTAQIKDIQVATKNGLQNLSTFLDGQNQSLAATINMTKPVYDAYAAQYPQLKAAVEAGIATEDMKNVVKAIEGYPVAVGAQQKLAQLESYKNGIDLNCDQSGFGIAPIIGIDAQYGRFNLALKYEFRTKMNLKNSSNLEEASLPATATFVDGQKVREDTPALLTVGLQYTPIDIVRINAGYHHFYDCDAKKTYFYTDGAGQAVRSNRKNDLLSKGTDEYLMGVEVDATDRLILSTGAQITRYGNTDKYISDISFVTDSWSFGFGASYQANPNVKIEAAYFHTVYSDYKTQPDAMGISNSFTRGNDVIGVGLVIDF